jgi:DNA-binding LytR/AlgR family response regulator
MPHSCVIIDDEPVAIEVIRSHLGHLDDMEVKAVFTNPVEAARYLRETAVDLIFLDIEMPVLSGFELLSTLPHPPKVIITTAHRDYAPEAFNMEVLDYLLKPISLDRLLKAVNRYYHLTRPGYTHPDKAQPESDEYIIIKADKKFHKVFFHDILYIESMDDFIRIHTVNQKLDCYERLVGMEGKLPGDKFLRIHRAYIVNLDKIDTFTNSSVEIGGRILVIGKKYRERIISILQSNQ